MNPFEMVLGIVLIVSIASVLRARFGIRRDKHGNDYAIRDDAETRQLREEVSRLKERVVVLERIATDKNHLLEQEIESLRDR
jgi:hypothetical protein